MAGSTRHRAHYDKDNTALGEEEQIRRMIALRFVDHCTRMCGTVNDQEGRNGKCFNKMIAGQKWRCWMERQLRQVPRTSGGMEELWLTSGYW